LEEKAPRNHGSGSLQHLALNHPANPRLAARFQPVVSHLLEYFIRMRLVALRLVRGHRPIKFGKRKQQYLL
jgi:hypothetical protein